MKYQIKLSNGEVFSLHCKPSVVNSTLILSSNKAILASYAPGQWVRVEREDLDDLIDSGLDSKDVDFKDVE